MHSADLFKNTDSFRNKTSEFMSEPLNHLLNRLIQDGNSTIVTSNNPAVAMFGAIFAGWPKTQ